MSFPIFNSINSRVALYCGAAICFGASPAAADHGPGTSGSGFVAESAETLKRGQWSAGALFDWTEFESVNHEDLIGADHFDILDRSFLTTLGVDAGVTDHFQIGISIGYYAAEGARRIPHSHSDETENELADRVSARDRSVRHGGHGNHGGVDPEPDEENPTAVSPETVLASFDPDGWTDLWVTGKHRVYRGPAGQLAFLAGVKAPVGETRVIDSAGLRVEPASAPGTGAWDGMAGVAYTFAATPDLAFDASAQSIFRGEKFDYQLGHRFDAGVAAGWRIFGSTGRYPQISVQGEVSVRHIDKSEEHGQAAHDTGGTVLFLSPGMRIGFSPRAAWHAGVQFPVVQELNGHQVETERRVTTGLSIIF